jgi:hypothetical protein
MPQPPKATAPCAHDLHRWRPALRANGRYRTVCSWFHSTFEKVQAYKKEHPEYGPKTDSK